MVVVLQLQDMTLQTGQLRFMRRSHLGWPPTPSAEAKVSPPPPGAEEQLLDLRAGDMCFMHGEMCHSGSQNTSAQLRMYLSTFICRLGYPHRDEFSCRAARALVAAAEDAAVVGGEAAAEWPRPAAVRRFFGDVKSGAAALAAEERAWAQLVAAEEQARL
eukprot:COSAG01_NODE_8624_length_2716_cov_2.982423_1_plen_160_part_00